MNGALTIDNPPLRETTGKDIRIAVIDSGIAAGHPHVGAVSAGVALVGDDANDTATGWGMARRSRRPYMTWHRTPN
jgi:hypothetical protein